MTDDESENDTKLDFDAERAQGPATRLELYVLASYLFQAASVQTLALLAMDSGDRDAARVHLKDASERLTLVHDELRKLVFPVGGKK